MTPAWILTLALLALYGLALAVIFLTASGAA